MKNLTESQKQQAIRLLKPIIAEIMYESSEYDDTRKASEYIQLEPYLSKLMQSKQGTFTPASAKKFFDQLKEYDPKLYGQVDRAKVDWKVVARWYNGDE